MTDRMTEALTSSMLQKIAAFWSGLPDKPEETPETTLRALWLMAAGQRVSAARAASTPLPPLDEDGSRKLEALIELRAQGQPLAYLTGRQTFLGLDLLAEPGAMIPRRETEIVGRLAVDSVQRLARERGEARVVDLCTGSGNLALAMAASEPHCRVWGVDITPEAVALAERNAQFTGLADRVSFLCGDLFAPVESAGLAGTLDLITCNPPYISSAHVDAMPQEIHEHEPRPAFDGGPFGIQILTRLVQEAPRFLTPGGLLCFEVGLGQGKYLGQMLRKNPNYIDIEQVADDSGAVRALRATCISN